MQVQMLSASRLSDTAHSRPKVPDGWTDDGARAIARRHEKETDAMLGQFGKAGEKVYNLASYRVARIEGWF